jgi:hypothetical protein
MSQFRVHLLKLNFITSCLQIAGRHIEGLLGVTVAHPLSVQKCLGSKFTKFESLR